MTPELEKCIRTILATPGSRMWTCLYTVCVAIHLKSCYKASTVLGLTGVSSVRKRVIALERHLGSPLLKCDIGGSRGTALGKEVANFCSGTFATFILAATVAAGLDVFKVSSR